MTNEIGIYNHDTGENLVREMTIDEQETRDAEIAENLAAKTKAKLDAELKAEARITLLERLGITEDEAKLLLS
jgi:hypothetical protein